MKKHKRIKVTVGIVLLAVLVVGLVWRRHIMVNRVRMDSHRGARAAVAVAVAEVRRETITDVRMFTGSLRSRMRYVVAPKVAGRLEELPLDIGEALSPNQLIARIDDEEYVQQVAQAEAVVEVARATVEQQATMLSLAEREMNRVRSLRDKQIASEAEWDAAESEYLAQSARHKVTVAQLAEKESSLRATQVRLSYTRINAPADIKSGRWHIEERYVDAGAMLAANTPVLAVADLVELIAVINVIERDYPAFQIGMSVTLETAAWPGTNFTGTVARMAPALRETSRQARIEIAVPNADLVLRPGMFVRARIQFGQHVDATVVPRGALARHTDVPGVFLIDTDKLQAHFVPITIGIQTPELIEVIAPELNGFVATLGRHLLSDGATVVLSESPNNNNHEPQGNASR